MENYQEQFYNEFLASIADCIEGNSEKINKLSESMTKLLSKYTVSLKSTEVSVYEVIPQCVKDYIGIRRIEGTAVSSLQLYGYKLKHFFSTLKLPIEKISINDIRRYLWELKEETNCSDRTLDNTRSIISTFFGWASAEGYIQSNPCLALKPIKYTCKERGHLTEMEVECLRNQQLNLRDRAILELLLATGCRVSELTNLKKSDVDMQTTEVHLLGKGSKYRTSYLTPKAIIALQAYLASRVDNNDYLFVSYRVPFKCLGKRTIEETILNIGRQANLARQVYPHLLRHTTATLGVQKGMPVQEMQKLLGHANIATTMIYADVADESVKQSHQKYNI